MPDPFSGGSQNRPAARFRVWAPEAATVEVRLLTTPEQVVPLTPQPGGYYEATVVGVEPGTLYYYRLDGQKERPDPASRSQPQGVHGPSQVIDPHFAWTDADWHGLPLDTCVFYELHVGTFTPEGTFAAIIPHLDRLKDLGITAVELMPVAQFPGTRNWGYDGVYLFAPQSSYGGPAGLKQLVNACHGRGLAVVLDVVYNHLGPEGNYLGDYGPYFADQYRTPWGEAINFDGPGSDEVRRFFIDNALYWITEYHIDALRLDAIHAIYDTTAVPFLQELGEAVHGRAEQLGRRVHLIAETNRNDPRLLWRPERGGCGLDAQWSDDFHRALHALLTGERGGYYADFGRLDDLRKALAEGYVLTGQYSYYRKRRLGRPAEGLAARQLVVFMQNHDLAGNRLHGERSSRLLPFEAQKLAAGLMLLSPYPPLLFMGEEYGETAPFLYFISHADPALIEAVRRGRNDLFAAFAFAGQPSDPQDEATFHRCRLNHDLRETGAHQALFVYYKELLRLRRTVPALADLSREQLAVTCSELHATLCMGRGRGAEEVLILCHFGAEAADVPWPADAGPWCKLLDSADARWLGPGSTVEDELAPHIGDTVRMPARSLVLFCRASGVA